MKKTVAAAAVAFAMASAPAGAYEVQSVREAAREHFQTLPPLLATCLTAPRGAGINKGPACFVPMYEADYMRRLIEVPPAENSMPFSKQIPYRSIQKMFSLYSIRWVDLNAPTKDPTTIEVLQLARKCYEDVMLKASAPSVFPCWK